MPLLQNQPTHHHGPLAGASAGAVGVFVGGGIILLACRRQLGEVASVYAVLLMIAGPLALGYAVVYGTLRLRQHARNPETLTRRPQVAAEVLNQAPQPLPAPQQAAELPAGAPDIHYHFDSAEAVEAALQAMHERQITESHHDPA